MRKSAFIAFLLISSMLQGQYVLNFDGQDDCFYSNQNAANGVRTIELWFKPAQGYGTNLSDYVSLICREGGPGPNYNEYHISIEPSHMTHPGHLRFSYFVSPYEYYDVFSNDNYWEEGMWYHVAGSFHPDSGMMLFVDGIRQEGKAPFYQATSATDYNIAVGSWGYPVNPNGGHDRCFHGSVDGIRLSSIARYSKDFTPPCPSLWSDSYTIALWNLEEGSGATIHDSSGNGNTAWFKGGVPEWIFENPCFSVGLEEIDIKYSVYPNPANSLLNIKLDWEGPVKISILNILGEKYINESFQISAGEMIRLDVDNVPSGTYFLLIDTEKYDTSEKLIIMH